MKRSYPFKIMLFIIILNITTGGNIARARLQDKGKPDNRDTSGIKLSVSNMRDDLFILWSAIQELHPAYGIYTPADSLEKMYRETLGAIQAPMNENDFISDVYPLLSRLGCGHTQLHHTDGYKGIKVPHLPFKVLVREHRAWITIHQTEAMATGEEIISINDTPVADIISHGSDLYAGDGYNTTFKELFLSEYDGFEDACNQYYHWMPPYRISLRTPQGVLKNLQIGALPEAQTLPVPPVKADARWITAKGTGYLPLRFLKNTTTAWFEVHSYQYSDTLIFRKAFKQIHDKGIQNLIIDLRHNTGGDIRIAAKLLSYLADSSFHIIRDVWSRLPDPRENHFQPYFDPKGTLSFRLGFQPGPREGDHYHVAFSPAFGNMLAWMKVDKKDHFSGNLFVLIDGATFSAGAHTAAAIKAQSGKAVFIGRETAGAEEGCSGGTVQHLTLPHTRIVVDFPWMRVVSVIPTPAVPGHGIIPDHRVLYSPEDIVQHNDPDIQKALELIR